MDNDGRLEKELKLNRGDRVLTADLHGSLNANIPDNVADAEKDFRFYSLWVLVDKEQKLMVGDICFMGEPAEDGQTEVGYGTYTAFREKGYMTEALGAMIMWAKKETGLKRIVAWTRKENLASFKVLQKNGFEKTKETTDLYFWMLHW
jgi:hypothetical protein